MTRKEKQISTVEEDIYRYSDSMCNHYIESEHYQESFDRVHMIFFTVYINKEDDIFKATVKVVVYNFSYIPYIEELKEVSMDEYLDKKIREEMKINDIRNFEFSVN